MDYILDTNFLIGVLRSKQDFVEKYIAIKDERLFISAITVTEMYAGCRETETKTTNELLNSLAILSIPGYIAKEAGEIIYKFSKKGKTIHLPDAVIGATTKLYHLLLLTQNIKDFPMLYPSQIERFPD